MQPIYIFQWFGIIIVAISIRSALSWRTFYVLPSKSSDTISCPADHCYSLQDVINNQSFFFDSNTTLELMPGRYNITEKVGQVIIYQVQNLLVKQSVVNQNVTIHCDSNTTFGLTVVGSSNVTISGLEIVHCSAAFTYMNLIKNMLHNVHYEYILSQYFQQWLDHPNSCDLESLILPCIATIFLIDNPEVTMQHTAILHSQHIGLFTVKNGLMVIVSSLMAYNNINCISYVNTNMHTPLDGAYETIIIESSFLFGRATNVSDSLASGLNIFLLVDTLYVREKRANAATAQAVYGLIDHKRQPSTSYVKVLNTSFVNNQGHHGNFYLVVYVFTMDFEVGVVIKNLSAVSDVNYPGLVVYVNGIGSILTMIHIEECTFLGCCMILLNQENTDSRSVDLEIIGISINKSRCYVAMFIDVSALLINITISYSHFSIINATNANLIFKENSYFYKNQGAFFITKGKVIFENVVLESNSAIQYDSVFCCDLSEVFFVGNAFFSNNTGKEAGAIVAFGSVLHFKDGTTKFIGNSGDNGGAISLNDDSVINIDGAKIIFIENKAKIYGGGIYARRG